MDFGFDRALEDREQESEGCGQVHFLLAERNPALDPAAAEVEFVVAPTVVNPEFFVHPLGDTLDSSACFFHASGMCVVDIDRGHDRILRFVRGAC